MSLGVSAEGGERRWVLFTLAFLVIASAMALVSPAAFGAAPTATVNPNPTVGYTTAAVSGTVDPGSEPVSVYFEYSLEANGGWRELSVGSLEAGEGPTPVSAELTGLKPGTEYFYRLDAYVFSSGTENLSPQPYPTLTTKAATPPSASLAPATAVTASAASFSGQIDPHAPKPEGSTSADEKQAFNTNWRFVCTPSCPELAPLEETVIADDGAHEVKASASALDPGTTYELLLVARNEGGEVTAGPTVFTTLAAPPTISSPTATSITATEATLGAQINPGGAETSYYFEYVPEAAFLSEGGFSSSATKSTPVMTLGSGHEAEPVEARVAGLTPGGAYRFRVAASNAATGGDEVYGPARSFLSVEGGGGQTSSGCSNEALRAENGSLALPDCRAYERVTPAFKNGSELSRTFVGNGPRLEGESLNNLGGSESIAPLGGFYEFVRSSGGWSRLPLAAPAGQYPGTNGAANPLYALGEDGASLLGLRTAPQPVDAESFYVRRGNSISEIGPAAPESSLVGKNSPEIIGGNESGRYLHAVFSTPDLSHVVFSLFSPGEHDYLWPFDETAEGQRRSLYEYVGLNNTQPLLVGVRGGEGSNALVSGCGTYLGSLFEEDIYNALSADGSTIFFTSIGEDYVGSCSSPAAAPAHTGVYARVDGEGPAARTVEVSEPTKADCSACQTEEPETVLKEAIFQGASEDGSQVFFLTEQELLPGNPGKNLYEYDFSGPAGEKVTAVSHLHSGVEAGVLGVARVSEDGSRVYFVATAALSAAPNSTGASAQSGRPNLYVYNTDTGSTAFVATLAPSDSAMWGTRDGGRQAEATPDGRFLLFASASDLTPDDTSSVSQLFRYDSATGQLLRVSVGRAGYGDNGNTDADPVGIPSTFDNFTEMRSGPPQSVMSSDGSYVFFESAKALTPKAVDDFEIPQSAGALAQNLYEWHTGEISLISDGRDRSHNGAYGSPRSSVQLLGTDSSAEDVFFTTTSPLVPGDTDSATDVYDARVGGGFPDERPSACLGDGCQSLASSTPPSPSANSSTFVGPGNPNHHKKKHHKKKHHKKKHHKKKHHKKKHHKKKHHKKKVAK